VEKVTKTSKQRIERRMRRVVLFWNGQAPLIWRSVTHSKDKTQAFFKWNLLVWQEIMMYVRTDRLVDEADLCWLFHRRGFTRRQRAFIKQTLDYVGLRRK
jgi:hypothetical protein